MECRRGESKGLCIRWANNDFVSILFGYVDGQHKLFIGKIKVKDDEMGRYEIEKQINFMPYPVNPDQNAKYKLWIKVSGEHIWCDLMDYNNSSEKWDPVKSIPVSESVSPDSLPKENSKGTFALIAMGSETFFGSIRATDLSPAKGAFSDLVLFMKPLKIY